MQRIRFFDTTLRDGELSPRFSPTADQRMQIARSLDAAGIDVIELACADDDEARLAESRHIATRLEQATVCILSPLNRDGLSHAREFIDGIARSRLHLYLDARRIRALESEPGLEPEIFREMQELIGAARKHAVEVEFSPQDATRTDPKVLARIVTAALDAGADIISISDTTGSAMPVEIGELFAVLRASVPNLDSAELSLHAHNHQGRAAQNALAAIEAGVAQIEGTIGGVGPAGGNTDLADLLQLATRDPGLRERLAHIDCAALEDLAKRAPFRYPED